MDLEADPAPRTSQDLKGKGKAKVQRSASPEPLPATEIEEETSDKPVPTAAQIYQELVKSGELGDVNTLSFFKNPTYNYRHQDTPIDFQSANQKLTITPEDREALLKGQPVHKVTEGPHRIMLTPNGDCVRNLTPAEEQRYLELQARIAKNNGPAAFYSARHHASNGFTLIGGRAVPNGPPSFFPTQNSTNTPMDPVSKIQRDEALSYINQYVLPSLSTNSQLEKALNANALDTEILRSGDTSAWASWGTDPATRNPSSSDGMHVSREGILATGLESMTAHFAIGGNVDRGQPLGNVALLSLADSETALQQARKETEVIEKKLQALIKKNKKLLLGSSSS
jgi:CCR4-NOT transcription complex subunit 4